MAVIVTCGWVLMPNPEGAGAQTLYGFGLGRWEGQAEFGVIGGHERTTVKGGTGTDFTANRARFDEQVTIRNAGAYYLDPRLVSTTASVTFGLVQEGERFNSTTESSNETLIDYSFDTLLLSEKPYSARLFANRNEHFGNLEFGGQSDVIFENYGATFTLREDSALADRGFPNFRSVLGARREITKEHTTVLGQTFDQDETRTIAAWEATKGFETSDLTLLYEFDDVEEGQGALPSFQTQTAGLNYSLDFGRDLNKRWESRLNYVDRTGSGPLSLLSVDEDLHIDHTEAFFSDYRYLFRRSDNVSGVTTTHTGIVRAQERFYRNLTISEQIDGALQDFPEGEHTSYAAQVDFDYRHSLPWNGTAFLAPGVRYQVDDNNLGASSIDVVDEPHVAPIPLGGNAGFTLANPFVITSTVVVIDTRGAARIPTTLGVDYIIDQLGNLTRIVPLDSSAVIRAGDPLEVSYSFEVNPSIRFSTVTWHANAGIDFRWIALTFTHEQSDETLLSGHDNGLLQDRRVDTVRVDLRGQWVALQADASAQYQVQDSTQLKYTSEELGQFISYHPLDTLTLNLTGQEIFTDFTLPQRQSQSYSARGDLVWTPPWGLYVNGFAEYLAFNDSQLPSETTWRVGLRARWTFRKLEVSPDIVWTDRKRGPVEDTDLRFSVRVIRRF